MQTIVHDIPNYLITLIEAFGAASCAMKTSWLRHRVRSQDFTRQRQLTFPVLMLFVLHKRSNRSNATCTNFWTSGARGNLQPLTSGQ